MRLAKLPVYQCYQFTIVFSSMWLLDHITTVSAWPVRCQRALLQPSLHDLAGAVRSAGTYA